MIERDLDREDSQNTALQFQKKINEVNIFSDITYPPPPPLLPQLFLPSPLQNKTKNYVVKADNRRPFGVLSTSLLQQPTSKQSALMERSKLISPTASESKKKVWFCDKHQLYFPNNF